MIARKAKTVEGASTSGRTARSAIATYTAGNTMIRSVVRISSSSVIPPK